MEFLVAPYEADAQMAFLALQGLVHAVITEDSDLIPYGCPRVSAVLSHAQLLWLHTQRSCGTGAVQDGQDRAGGGGVRL